VGRATRGYGNRIKTWDDSTVIEAKYQHPQSSWEPALILVTGEKLIADIYFTVDASVPFFSFSKLPVQYHH
jgi:hypothetical protein